MKSFKIYFFSPPPHKFFPNFDIINKIIKFLFINVNYFLSFRIKLDINIFK